MNNFTFENTTRIHFGAGQIEKLAEEIPEGSKTLVLYGGGSIKSNGVYEQVAKHWKEKNGVSFQALSQTPSTTP